jgi:hypothetical protein
MSNRSPAVAPGPVRDGTTQILPETPGPDHSTRDEVAYGIRGEERANQGEPERGRLGNPGDVDAVGKGADGGWTGPDGRPVAPPPEAANEAPFPATPVTVRPPRS